MIDAFSEFLTENSQRRYPLSEGCSRFDNTDTFEVPDSLILDYRGFHRVRNEMKPRIAAIVGPSAADDPTYPTVAGKLSVYVEVGAAASPTRICLFVNPTSGEFPMVQGSVQDPSVPAANLAFASMTFGAGRSAVGDADRWVFDEASALLEPSLTIESYRSQVDLVRIVHQSGPDEYVSGDIKVRGGYSVVVNGLPGGRIVLSASPGAGELGRFTGSVRPEESEYCTGTVMTLNRSAPNAKGEFFFEEGSGIKITPLPDEHKIQIAVSPGSLKRPLCI